MALRLELHRQQFRLCLRSMHRRGGECVPVLLTTINGATEVSILFPVFAMFVLTSFCVFRLASLRFSAVRQGEIDPRFFRLFQNAEEPDHLRVYSRHLANLFEAPVLFYVVVIIAFVTQQTGILPLSLAWAYVVFRYAHSYVHLTSNRVMTRFYLFALSWIFLVLLWVVTLVGILLN
jgi:hypothetical protein